jgi:hypothetical protein
MNLLLALLLHSAAAQPSNVVHLDPRCPVEPGVPVRRDGDRCIGQLGPNFRRVFVYPVAAVRYPLLHAQILEENRVQESDFANIIEYARTHADDQLFHEDWYVVGIDTPKLLSLSHRTDEYSGGAHGWSGVQEIYWDVASDAPIAFEALFSDPEAAFAEMRRLYCPAFVAVRRNMLHGAAYGEACPITPGALVVGPSGRVETLLLSFGELDGRAHGDYEAEIPVSRTLITLVHPRFRDAFEVSAAAPRVCNPNVSDDDCR